MLPDITDLTYHTAAYPHQAPDAPEQSCEMCGRKLTENEIERNGWYCGQCRSEMEEI
jgi:ribosomal protein L37AE/L43A